MKRMMVILLVLVGICANAQEKINGCYLRMIEPVQSDTLIADNGIIRVYIDFDSGAYFAKLAIENLTDNVVEIDWDKFLMLGDKSSKEIIFDDTVMAFANNPKGSTPIAPHTKIRKSIVPKENVEYSTKLFQKKYAKIRAEKVGFLIPIVNNGNTTYFQCAVEAYVK